MRRLLPNKTVGGLAVCVSLLMGSAVLAPWASSADESAETTQRASAHYAVLDGPASSRDEHFARESTWLSELASSRPELGLRGDLARVVSADWPRTLAVVPAGASPCLVSGHGEPGSTMACGTASEPTTALINYGTAIGIVPDSVTTVVFEMTDGTILNRDVEDNLWHAPAEATTAHIVIDGASVTVELMPLSSRPKGAVTDSDGVTTIHRDGTAQG